jgi:3-hydroxyisobutyryl-CoA hydrolase
LVSEEGHVKTLILNRPQALNALNFNMIRLIRPHLLPQEKRSSMIIIKGAGGKAFCAGGDIRGNKRKMYTMNCEIYDVWIH